MACILSRARTGAKVHRDRRTDAEAHRCSLLAPVGAGAFSPLMTTPTHLLIEVADLRFRARLEATLAPTTCAAFLRILPFEDRLIQTRWSGESAWIPMGDRDLG